MSANNGSFILSRYVAITLMACALMSCSAWFTPAPPKQVRHEKPATAHYVAEAYVKHLAFAELTPEPADDDLDIIDAYATQKSSKPERQTIVVLEYETGGEKKLHQVVAPIPASIAKSRCTALAEIMNRLSERENTLHNIHLEVATVTPGDALKLPDSMDQIKPALDQQQQLLLSNAEKLPVLDDARLQLQLTRFFIDNRFRDAAYLSVDNIKHLLATATTTEPGDTDTIKKLSQELEAVETQLHKAMPFTAR